ncbi:hypothetical protein DVA86_32795 [Streptomyces armeniacus]|uniref:DUF3159 domain-containing protein n=1 Tax=Streptomyces armeniacus TaxID=83291 RepID=A0A345XYC2_9ACTN|nr:VC0807 family protein [Streptomyces armeniacus]AXK36638.1 hypothetical protein DVA86_32795 [Streptomyces armeniacus]QIQ28608.1 Nbc12 [Streptomyces sp.]
MPVAPRSTHEPEHAPPPPAEPEGRTEDQPETEGGPGAKNASRGEFAVTLLCDLVLPMGLFYVFRAAGLGQLPSLLLSAAPPALHTLYSMTKHRRVDTLGVFVLGIVVLSASVSAISGDPRAVLVRGAVLTGLISLWILSTIWLARPFVFRALEALLPGKRAKLDQLWREDAAFRRIWQRLTVLWGCGLLADAVIRLVMAYTLPVDTVPALEGILYAVTWCLLQLITQLSLSRSGTFRKIFGDKHSPFARFRKKDGKDGADGETQPAAPDAEPRTEEHVGAASSGGSR